ncbi:hypothetical protein HBI62_193120 [Parastagonospora nodorum]|nr:hypothetical protein HBI62_193120 [Parastagonospora nodorum]KAH6144173.1 hypothetical protein HBI63_179840 [Parastagonospora nodorum]
MQSFAAETSWMHQTRPKYSFVSSAFNAPESSGRSFMAFITRPSRCNRSGCGTHGDEFLSESERTPDRCILSTKPDDHPRRVIIHRSHIGYLAGSLGVVVLSDANCIDPENPALVRLS